MPGPDATQQALNSAQSSLSDYVVLVRILGDGLMGVCCLVKVAYRQPPGRRSLRGGALFAIPAQGAARDRRAQARRSSRPTGLGARTSSTRPAWRARCSTARCRWSSRCTTSAAFDAPQRVPAQRRAPAPAPTRGPAAVRVIVPTEAVARGSLLGAGPRGRPCYRHPRGRRRRECTVARAARSQRQGSGSGCLSATWSGSGGLRHPGPGQTRDKARRRRHETLPLVLVGPTRPWAHELPDVTLTGEVSDDQLAAIYSGAQALLVLSEHEGCGLPAVEALACGTPVVACETPALREVLDGRATFVEPCDMRGADRRCAKLPSALRRAAPAGPGRTRRARPGASTGRRWPVWTDREHRRPDAAPARPRRGSARTLGSGPSAPG